MPAFSSRDPNAPAFWDERFERSFTPWDRGGTPDQLRAFVAGAAHPLRILIPGCGRAWELVYLSQAGWDATAIDFSASAVATARAAAGAWGARLHEADFFEWAPSTPLQMIYERAFLCSMPPHMWPQVAERWAALLAPGTLLAGFFFFDDMPKGPPFGISRARLSQLLHPYFFCIEDTAVADSVPVFAGKERWQVWQRATPHEAA